MKLIEIKNVEDITLLSVEEAEVVPKEILGTNHWWWLRSPSNDFYYAAHVRSDGTVTDAVVADVELTSGGIRPALRIKNLKSLNLQIGEKVECLSRTWFYVGGNLLLSEYIIDFGPFNAYRSKGNDFSSSDIKRYLYEMFAKWLDEYDKWNKDIRMKPELKPCPFCGGEAILEAYDVNCIGGGFSVHCSKCDIGQENLYDVDETAIERWNRRVKEDEN